MYVLNFWKLIHVCTSIIGVLFVILQDAAYFRTATDLDLSSVNILYKIFPEKFYLIIALHDNILSAYNNYFICKFLLLTQMAANLLLVLFCYYWLLLAGGVVSGFTPVTYPARVSSECGQYDPLQDEQLTEALIRAYQQFSPDRSCQEILHRFPSIRSGYYQIIAPNDTLVQVYCDMEGTNCGGEGGWMHESSLCQHVTARCHLPSGTDTANPLRTDSLW